MAHPRKRSGSKKDLNVKVSESITQTFIEMVMGLTDPSPKTAYLKQTLLDKFVSKETDPASVRRQRAINKWLSTERRNDDTNVRMLLTPEDYHILPRVSFGRFVEQAREIIRAIVGDMPEDDDFIGGFSGGASTSKRRTESHPASKFLGEAHITPDAQEYWKPVWETCNAWNQFGDRLVVKEVVGNEMFTVLKNALIDRVAAKEPDLNMFMQRGLGTKIRRCLRRHGIDLNDQSINRDLARVGSKDGSLATLDLSSASDSVSRGLVQLLMPEVWYASLSSLRSPITVIDGEEHVNEMFSSMGNGFTFELESLLFYALARATAYFTGTKGVISVYGDDIIVPTDMAHDLIWILSFFGFEVNTEKTFIDGPFRESCGGHFINGRDVTPFYLRKPIERLTDVMHIANALRHWASSDTGILDLEVWTIWSYLASFVPRRFWGGRDCSSIYQLVTPHHPRAMLVPVRKKKSTGDGGYLHWLCALRSRSESMHGRSSPLILDYVRLAHDLMSDPSSIQMSEMTQEVGRCEVRKARRTVPLLTELFLEELE